MELRAAEPADIRAIAELLLRASPGRTLEHEVGYVGAYFERADTRVQLAVDDGRPIGVVSFESSLVRGDQVTADDVAYLRLIAVDPDHWGSGLATELMAWAVDAMRASGYSGVNLWCGESNGRARRFYEREGWQLTDRRRIHDDWGPMVSYELLIGSEPFADPRQ